MDALGLLTRIVVIVLQLSPSQSAQGPNPNLNFSEAATFEGATLFFEGGVGPSNFFKGLRRIDDEEGSKFQKNGTNVEYFPERLTIRIRVLIPQLHSKRKSQGKKLDHPDLMRNLRFEAHWKRGTEMRPVKQLEIQTLSESTFPPQGDVWIYDLVLEDSSVPLSDHLIIDVFSGKTSITRLAAYL